MKNVLAVVGAFTVLVTAVWAGLHWFIEGGSRRD
jgi:hypothetical protein